ncbi:chemotaxis protein CheX [Pelagicoccus sp. SDUM812003]|uniref:chemotaxis protein CheX n=1 Tax=Pelagicoccus sp. SDUM812003 TaxID=3041267 RepID=UPI00281041D6|nr:chemotaxis protein CheX [Pelagicoccus sp. SDUM812003]MDQ8201678.1 chemotaxis protein CheX [Pelagicoccus sp. SDUM812003]
MSVSVPVEKIHEFLSSSLVKVIDTMMSVECKYLGHQAYSGTQAFSPKIDPAKDDSKRMFASSVGFAGEISGVCYLFMSENFGYQAAQKITGLDREDLDDDVVRDVCGELTNMFAGTFKNRLADLGLPSTLTIPTVVQGKRMAISTAGTAQQYRFSFECIGFPIYADLLLSSRN